MKNIVLILLAVFAIGCKIIPIWVVVEFCLFLFKDLPFNWQSVWITVACWIITILLWVTHVILDANNRSKPETFKERLRRKNNE